MSPRDVNLALVTAATAMAGVGAKGNVIDTEGGFFGVVRMFLGACAGTTTIVDVQVEASIDGGSNYYHIGQFPKLDEDDDNVEIARPVYVPKPASGQTVTKVRLYTRTSSGSGAAVACNSAHLEPLISLGIPGVDADLGVGVEELV